MLTDHNKTKRYKNVQHTEVLFRCFSTSTTNKDKALFASPNKDIYHNGKRIQLERNKTDMNSKFTTIPSSSNQPNIKLKNKLRYHQIEENNQRFSYATLSKKQRICSNGQINLKTVTNDNNITTLFRYSTTINTKNPFSYSNYASLISIRKRMHQILYK